MMLRQDRDPVTSNNSHLSAFFPVAADAPEGEASSLSSLVDQVTTLACELAPSVARFPLTGQMDVFAFAQDAFHIWPAACGQISGLSKKRQLRSWLGKLIGRVERSKPTFLWCQEKSENLTARFFFSTGGLASLKHPSGFPFPPLVHNEALLLPLQTWLVPPDSASSPQSQTTFPDAMPDFGFLPSASEARGWATRPMLTGNPLVPPLECSLNSITASTHSTAFHH